MGKAMPDATGDAYLAKIASATTLVVCSAEPADYAAIASLALAEAELTPGNGNGDFTFANGDVSGRKVTVAAQSNMPIDASGSGNHVALHDGESLVYVTTATAQALTSGGTVSTNAFDIELNAPT